MSFADHGVTAKLHILHYTARSRSASRAQDGTLITFAGRSLQEACSYKAYAVNGTEPCQYA